MNARRLINLVIAIGVLGLGCWGVLVWLFRRTYSRPVWEYAEYFPDDSGVAGAADVSLQVCERLALDALAPLGILVVVVVPLLLWNAIGDLPVKRSA